MLPVDILASLLTLANVWLVVRRSLWNYPFGLAAVAVSAWSFWHAKLYSDVVLQGFFFAVQFYGWWVWARHREAGGATRVRWLRWPAHLGWLAVAGAATILWGALMRRYTDAALPWWDAANLGLSVTAQLLMSRRFADNWVLWVIVDLDAIALYAAKDLWAFATLYVVLTALAAWGLRDWWRASRRSAVATPSTFKGLRG